MSLFKRKKKAASPPPSATARQTRTGDDGVALGYAFGVATAADTDRYSGGDCGPSHSSHDSGGSSYDSSSGGCDSSF